MGTSDRVAAGGATAGYSAARVDATGHTTSRVAAAGAAIGPLAEAMPQP